jgi:hypothetical protein
MDWKKLWKASVRIGDLRAEIWTRELPYTKQECQSLNYNVYSKSYKSNSRPINQQNSHFFWDPNVH